VVKAITDIIVFFWGVEENSLYYRHNKLTNYVWGSPSHFNLSEDLADDLLLGFTFHICLELEASGIYISHISACVKVFQVRNKSFELCVIFIEVEWEDWDTIFELVSKWINSVINQNHVFEISVGENSQIFDVKTLFGLDTAVSEEPMMDQLFVRIKMVQDNIGVAAMRGCKDNYLKVFI